MLILKSQRHNFSQTNNFSQIIKFGVMIVMFWFWIESFRLWVVSAWVISARVVSFVDRFGLIRWVLSVKVYGMISRGKGIGG